MKKIFTLITLSALLGVGGASAAESVLTVNFENVVAPEKAMTIIKINNMVMSSSPDYATKVDYTGGAFEITVPSDGAGMYIFQPNAGYVITSFTADPSGTQFSPNQMGGRVAQFSGITVDGVSITSDSYYLEYNPYSPTDTNVTYNVVFEEEKNIVIVNLEGSGLEEGTTAFNCVALGSNNTASIPTRSNLDSNTIKYLIEDENLNIFLAPLSGYRFSNVALSDGSTITYDYNSVGWYTFTVPATETNYGSEITITVSEDASSNIYFDWTLPEDASNPFIISSLKFLGETTSISGIDALDDYFIKFGNVNTDSTLTIYFAENNNTPIYQIGSVTASYTVEGNDTPIEISSDKFNVTDAYAEVLIPYVDGMNMLYITVKLAEQGKTVTVNIDNSDAIIMKKVSDGEIVPLEGEKTEITLGIEDELTFIAADGFEIVSAVYASGQSVSSNIENVYTTENLKDGGSITIETQVVAPEEEYEDAFTIWFNPEEIDEFSKVVVYKGEGNLVTTVEGVTESIEIPFNESEGQTFMVQVWTNNDDDTVYPFVAGISRGEIPMEYTHTVYTGAPVDGMSIKLYVTEPETYSVELVAEESASESDVTVLSNGIYTLSGWANATSYWQVLPETYFTITVPDDYTVAVNGEAQEVTSEGEGLASYDYEFTADAVSGNEDAADFTIVITGTVGINSIESSISTDDVIYNLQGVRVNRDNLGKGIYIINGKKVMVK